MDTLEKLEILTDAAKYDVACTSSGTDRKAPKGGIGSCAFGGICHSFSADGRCIALLKVLMSNCCSYDCAYCVNRRSNDVRRATFEPRELAELTLNFYRRNYIEGLFLSSGVIGTPDRTMELMIKTLKILREEYRFYGYVHAKAIPGASDELTGRLGMLADRMSVNIELPSQNSLAYLAPDKSRHSILKPMEYIRDGIKSKGELVKSGGARFVPAGQSTQMIVGASPETDFGIIRLAEGLYRGYNLKRVFFSAYVPVVESSKLPSLDTRPPLLREHRLYQADWLLRYYGFTANEILDEQNPYLNRYMDPKCAWAIRNMDLFPVEVSTAEYERLLRVPGIGVKSAKRIVAIRRHTRLSYDILKKAGTVLKRAVYFITCNGQRYGGISLGSGDVTQSMLSDTALKDFEGQRYRQISMFDDDLLLNREERLKCLTGEM